MWLSFTIKKILFCCLSLVSIFTFSSFTEEGLWLLAMFYNTGDKYSLKVTSQIVAHIGYLFWIHKK